MYFLIISIILIVACLSSKIMYKLGLPTLITFIGIGIFLGVDGPGNISFNDAELAKEISTFALIFIMFFGGFGLNWKKAKSIAISASVLATLGVVVTAFIIGIFVHFVFGLGILESMLLGSIVSSTDAASVFSILNTHKLNLKKNMSHLLEMESGSNDPISYMLTLIFISLILNQQINVPLAIFTQISLGLILGLVIGKLSVIIFNKINLEIDGLYSILLVGFVIFSFSFSEFVGGNGFLSVYVTGIILGNQKIVHRFSMVKYFDGLTWLMQIVLFLTLGLLSTPTQLYSVIGPGIIVSIFLIIVARPLAVFILLMFTKYDIKDKLIISIAGIRGAASIVFATYALSYNLAAANWIFNIVFVVALSSIIVQGLLFIPLAKKFDLVEDEELSLTKFYDESGKISADILEIQIESNAEVVGKSIMDMDIPDNILVVMISRNNKVITPKGGTIIKENDKIIFAGDKEELLKLQVLIHERKKNALKNIA